ncbi:hypothetical protein A3Q56_03927 [Intoshia linei]|uniref:Ig-like domain-containing protein n=1 Tax=Intoshia linei TaxID=1819745 RepID=A0A177B206_9BILA|nr:hypothetical protein A3Q56_03927 [Intoshia linei]
MHISIIGQFVIYCYFYLTVKLLAIEIADNKEYVEENSQIIIPCHPTPTNKTIETKIRWTEWVNNNNSLTPMLIYDSDTGINLHHIFKDQFSIVEDDNNSDSLKISNVTYKDTGKYICSHLIENQEIKTTHHDLIVTGKINCTYKVENGIELIEGSNATVVLKCTMRRQGGLALLQWKHNGQVMISNDTSTTLESGVSLHRQFTKDMYNIDKPFICSVIKNDNITCSQELNIKYRPKNLKITPNKSNYNNGDQVNCTSDGNPVPLITWQTLDERVISTGKGYAVLTISDGIKLNNNNSKLTTNENLDVENKPFEADTSEPFKVDETSSLVQLKRKMAKQIDLVRNESIESPIVHYQNEIQLFCISKSNISGIVEEKVATISVYINNILESQEAGSAQESYSLQTIILIACGGVLFLILIIILIVFCVRRQKRSNKKEMSKEKQIRNKSTEKLKIDNFDTPIKFSESYASKWTSVDTFDRQFAEPDYSRYIVVGSFAAMIIYFAYLRKPNKLDVLLDEIWD